MLEDNTIGQTASQIKGIKAKWRKLGKTVALKIRKIMFPYISKLEKACCTFLFHCTFVSYKLKIMHFRCFDQSFSIHSLCCKNQNFGGNLMPRV